VSFIDSHVFAKHTPPEDVAAVVVEPIQGEGGYVTPPPGFFEKLAALCRKYGILLVVDEIQSGMGRTGKWWAIQHWDAVPDVLTIAKGIASGLPLGATVATAELMSWPPGSHGNTFGGNPVACEAALATLDLVEERLLANARRVGAFMGSELAAMVERHPSLGWVNGMGLMLAVEFVTEPGGTSGDAERRDEVVQAAFRRGLLLLGAGPSAIRFCPPLTLSRQEAQIGLEILEDAIAEVEARGTRRDGGGRRGGGARGGRGRRNGNPAGGARVARPGSARTGSTRTSGRGSRIA
jgi:4-aminobutyrate aminotransferase